MFTSQPNERIMATPTMISYCSVSRLQTVDTSIAEFRNLAQVSRPPEGCGNPAGQQFG
jgi:hypothetical protein